MKILRLFQMKIIFHLKININKIQIIINYTINISKDKTILIILPKITFIQIYIFNLNNQENKNFQNNLSETLSHISNYYYIHLSL